MLSWHSGCDLACACFVCRQPAAFAFFCLRVMVLRGVAGSTKADCHMADVPAVQTTVQLASLSKLLQVVALVGPSGGGKSSIIRLLERFYLPSSGAILVDGRDVGCYDAKWLKRRVALVAQEPVLYARCAGVSLRQATAVLL